MPRPVIAVMCRTCLALLLLMSISDSAVTAENLLDRSRAVLSQLEGEIQLPGMHAAVEVLRDQWGIAHIYAQNQHDLFFAQGFVAAQDRMFQLDLWRRIGVGNTAEILGEEGIEGDRFARLIRYRGDQETEWSSYAPDAREIATAFTAGINAYIDQAVNKLPIEFQLLGYAPPKWQPEDVLGRMSGIIMTSNWQREVARARLVARHGVEAARQIAPTDPPRDFAPAPELDLNWITPDIVNGYAAATRLLTFTPSATESNNWVVDATLSASGKPLLASDPHRATTLPSLRYMVHLHAPGWNVIGAGEPALPGVAIGHNERIAWGFTIVGTDQADLFVEQTRPGDPRQYLVGDQWQPMQTEMATIQVRGKAEPVTTELRFTRHGPVIYQDESRNVAVALKWAGSEPGGAAYLASLSVARAQNREQFVAALERWKIPCLNFVYADVEGQIGWVAAAATPIRATGDGLLPVPGWTDKHEWRGYLPVKHLPQSFNPAEHWLATANHNILPADYPHTVAHEWSAPHRFQRIRQRLTGQSKFSLADFQEIQHENTSLPALQLAGILKQVELSPEQAPFGKLLIEWDGVLSIESQAGPLYAVWLQELQKAFYRDRLEQDPRLERGDLRSTTLLLQQLERPLPFWFGDDPAAGRDRLVRETLQMAIARTKQLLGENPSTWQWGKLHTATFQHPLAGLGPEYAESFNAGPVPRPGDVHTPNNTRHDETFRQVHGASYRQVIDLADWDSALATSAPGQSGQPGSQHYADLLPLWARGEYFPLVYSRQKVEQATRHRLTLKP